MHNDETAQKIAKSYRVVVYDVFGEETVIDGLRQTFATYDALRVMLVCIVKCMRDSNTSLK